MNESTLAATRPKNVKTRDSGAAKKQALRPGPTLGRTTFVTSREMDFFSEKELVTQTGHGRDEWPLVFLKETIDNALDACEEAGVSPVISVTADACAITVTDNGPGLPESTLQSALDFTVRASNREAYVAPDRGAQGNALKTLLPMARVIDPDQGRLIIQAHGKRHTISCGADPVSQRAVILGDVTELPTCGTEVRIEWGATEDPQGDAVWPFDDLNPDDSADQFLAIVEGFVLFNPHATIRLDWFGRRWSWPASAPNWVKWTPNRPTSPHWYEPRHLARLIGAYITHDRDSSEERLVSDFVAEFDGLSGSQKRSKVLADSDLKRAHLSEFVVDGRLNEEKIGTLLEAMQRHTRKVQPQRLGIIGEEHLKARLLGMGVKEESFRYAKKVDKGAVPAVVESAFGWLGEEAPDERRIYAGANWSAAIKNPFRTFGGTGEGLEAALHEARVGRCEPIVLVLHLAHPRVEYADRGKSAIVLGGGND